MNGKADRQRLQKLQRGKARRRNPISDPMRALIDRMNQRAYDDLHGPADKSSAPTFDAVYDPASQSYKVR